MGTQPAVVEVDGYRVESSTASAEDLIATFTPKKDDSSTPREVKAKGSEPEKSPLSKAASELGKKGGKAAAAARVKADKEDAEEEAEQEAKSAPDRAAKPDKAAETKKAGEAEGDNEEAESADRPLGKPRNDPRARIQQLATERDEHKRRADAAEARATAAERTKAQPAKEEKPEPVQASADPAKPKLADFLANHNTYDGAIEAYEDARDTYRDKQFQTRQAQEEGHRKVVEHISTHVDTFHERLTGLPKNDPGQKAAFDEFMGSLPEALLAPPSFMLPRGQAGSKNLMADLAIKSDKPREVYEHWADNPDDYQRIAALQDPLLIAGEMAILSHSLDAATAGTSSRPEASRAKPHPVKPVTGTPHAIDGWPADDSSYDDHVRVMNAKDKGRRRR